MRSLRNERQTERRVFQRQLRRAALHPDELQGRRVRRRLHARARGRAFDAHLVRAATQLYQDYDYPIFLAEVASTFNEELLTHHLLEQTDDPKMRAYLINRQIDDIRGTLFRQTMFAEFEKIIHAIEESGEALTLDVFKSEYRKLLEAYFGDDFVLDAELDLECLRIPHFYSAFYVYKYATGISAAVALSEHVLSGAPGSGRGVSRFLEIRRLEVSARNAAESRVST